MKQNMKQKIPNLDKFIQDVKGIYGNKLQRIILFGSYARNEQTHDSDVDIFIIVNLDKAVLKRKDNELYDASYEMTISSGISVNPMAVFKQKFGYWKFSNPLYQNICKEGITLYEYEKV